MMIQSTAHCPACAAPKLHARKGLNHPMHAGITLLTCGGWIMFYLIILAVNHINHSWRCQTCGSVNHSIKTPLFDAMKTKQA